MISSGLHSLKRIQSASTSKVSGGSSSTEPTGKLAKLKSRLRIWTKLTRSFTSQQHEPPSLQLSPLQVNDDPPQSQQLHPTKWQRRWSQHVENRRLLSLLNNSPLNTQQETPSRRESFYEPSRLLSNKTTRSYSRLNLRRNSELNAMLNIQTVPVNSPPLGDISSNSNSWAVLSDHHLKAPASILVKHDSSTISTRGLGVPVRHKYSSITSASHQRMHHCRYRLSSSNITANSEDLTAKEFADIAGIRILDECDPRASNNDSYCFDEDAVLHNTISTFRSHTKSIPSTTSLRAQPQIWDTEFWQYPDTENSNGKQQRLQQEQVPSLRRLRTRSNEKHTIRNSCVIKKGRFEICLETAASRDEFMAACIQSK